MVINCVPDARKRGLMLLLLFAHLRPGGLLFLMLPLQCLTRSHACSRATFSAALAAVGFQVVATRDSPKVAFFAAARPVACNAPSPAALARASAQRAADFPFPASSHGVTGKGSSDFGISFV